MNHTVNKRRMEVGTQLIMRVYYNKTDPKVTGKKRSTALFAFNATAHVIE